MRLSCLSIGSILFFVFLALSVGDYALPELGERRLGREGEDSLHHYVDGQPECELNGPSHTSDLEQEFETMSLNREDRMGIDGVPAPGTEDEQTTG
mgnify:CR=1 FL=1